MMGRRQLSLRLARRARTRAFLPFLEQVEDRVVLSTFVVTNTNDSGPGSLRQAILDSNATDLAATGGTSEIDFAIPASTAAEPRRAGSGFDPVNQTWTITLDSPLPAITNPVTIDGYSQAEAGVPYRYPSQLVPLHSGSDQIVAEHDPGHRRQQRQSSSDHRRQSNRRGNRLRAGCLAQHSARPDHRWIRSRRLGSASRRIGQSQRRRPDPGQLHRQLFGLPG